MTKNDFIQVWAGIEPVVTKKVNDQIAINSYCELVDHVGGYQLILKPQTLLWENEISLIVAVTNVLGCSCEMYFKYGYIRIF